MYNMYIASVKGMMKIIELTLFQAENTYQLVNVSSGRGEEDRILFSVMFLLIRTLNLSFFSFYLVVQI